MRTINHDGKDFDKYLYHSYSYVYFDFATPTLHNIVNNEIDYYY